MKANKTSNQTSADKDTELTKSRQTESGQTDIGQKIRIESGQLTDTGHDLSKNPDKYETRTGHGQCCPLMVLIPAEIRQHFVPRKVVIDYDSWSAYLVTFEKL